MKQVDLWYKRAVIYSLDVELFMDSNGDGIGDFPGLIARLGELAELGVNCIWLLPFYPTPNRDNGYDVKDYYNVDPRLGTLGDFVELIHRAHDHGIRVLIDLVVNHTSDEHPWFQMARADPDSKYRNYYVWEEEEPETVHVDVAFPPVQLSTWTYDEQARAWYFHHFYSFQPDLNVANPDVQAEIRHIMGFWLQLGVSGFRLDAVPFLIQLHRSGDPQAHLEYDYLKVLRQFTSWRRGDAILLAEANIAMEHIHNYYGDGDRLHMVFNFTMNQHLFLALARQTAQPLIDVLSNAPEIGEMGQWALFLRNHDELSLDRLSTQEREEVFEAFGPEANMQIFDRGLRRRLAPLLNNDRRRIELANSLLFTLPGTPVIYYGDEIGMGEDLSMPERNSVRTPMQWSSERNAGFSSAAPDKMVRPVIDQGEYRYEKVNFASQRRDRGSLLHWMENAIHVRKNCQEFGLGDWEVIQEEEPSVLACRYWWEGGEVIAIHNLADKPVSITLNLDPDVDHIIDLLSNRLYDAKEQSREVDLDGYGFRWLRLLRGKEPK